MSLCNLCSFFSYFNWRRATLIESKVSLHVVMTSFVQLTVELTRTFPESIKMLTESLFSISQPPRISILGPTMTQRIKKANSSWESAWNLNVEIIKKIFGELTRLAESQRNHERTEKQQETNSSRPYSFHLKPANNNDNYKERKAKNKETYRKRKKNCNPNFKPMRAFAFFGGLVAILNGLCSLTAAGPAIVTAYICCSRSCCCCSSNNIKYTYTYNLPRAAPRWEVVQGLWCPKLGE